MSINVFLSDAAKALSGLGRPSLDIDRR
jgi:hypothetical protein